ncbi:MAG: glycosyl hydrolase family 39, partial [Gammaproteobacteria bacterium]|nr:glycosyl hydrolase family 39 [Gammaproteobacteria bacterium]
MRRISGFLLLLAGVLGGVVIAAAAAAAPTAALAGGPIVVDIDAAAAGTPFPHFWEQMFGSGHAVLALRAGYRRDVQLMKQAADFRYVRFHGILDDEVGLYDVDKHGAVSYNFSYVDQIYDGLLAAGVRPFVELSFMPQGLARDPKNLFSFWYKPNISPP